MTRYEEILNKLVSIEEEARYQITRIEKLNTATRDIDITSATQQLRRDLEALVEANKQSK